MEIHHHRWSTQNQKWKVQGKIEDLSWSLWPVYMKLWLNNSTLTWLIAGVHFWQDLRVIIKLLDHIYIQLYMQIGSQSAYCQLFFTVLSWLMFMYIVNTIKKQTAGVHCQYSTRYFNLWFRRVNLIVHLLNCLVLAVRDCARIAVNKSFATDRHSITEQSSWTLGAVELLTTWCLQLSWCKS